MGTNMIKHNSFGIISHCRSVKRLGTARPRQQENEPCTDSLSTGNIQSLSENLFQMHNNVNEFQLHLLLPTVTQFPLAQEPFTFKNNKIWSHSHLKRNKSILDGYFKSPGKVKWSEQKGLIIIMSVTSWRKCRAGASGRGGRNVGWSGWHQFCLFSEWLDFAEMRTRREGAEQGQISSSVWAACQWAWEWACRCSVWEKGKHAIGCYLGQALEKRAVGLDILVKYNCKWKLATVSTPDTLKC